MTDPRVDLIKTLTPVANKLIRQTIKRYENGAYAYCFTEAILQAEAEDLMLKMYDGVASGEIEAKGIYNYFTTAFKNKCKDRYHAHAKTKKRGGVVIENKDLSDCPLNDGSLNFCPEEIVGLKQEIESLVNFLSTFDKPKVKYSLIIKKLLEGVPPEEIQKEMGMSASSLDRYKAQALEILKSYPKNVKVQDFYPEEDCKGDLPYREAEEKVIKYHLSREIKFNSSKSFGATFKYVCRIELYQQNKLINKRNLTLRELVSHNKDEFLDFERTDIKLVENECLSLINQVSNELKTA